MAAIKIQLSRFAFMSNPYRVIKLLAFVTGLCMVSCTTALAQQSLFVYLQSENLQPFYVQIGDKVYSSSAIGHLVISGLPDNTYNIEIGFPQHTIQPQRFSVPLRNKDHGYQLVKNGSKGWALYDWLADETIKPIKSVENSNSLLYGERKKDDAFATLMAAVVNDSAVLYTSVVKKETETAPAVAKNTEPEVKEKQPEIKPEEKKVRLTDTVISVIKTDAVTVVVPPLVTDTASLVKNEPVTSPAPDTAAGKTDTLVTKYDPKERGLNEKQKVGGVAKIQQQTKDGETKMVFVDSSETPAKIVTVYINEEKQPAEDKQVAQTQTPPAQLPVTQPVETNTAKTDTKQEPAVKEPEKAITQAAKQEVVETAKKEEPVKKDSDKIAPAPTREEIAEQIKKETWKQASEKKPSATDTVTIILESRQMKKSTTAAEDPAPLYRPKKEVQPAPEKPVVPDTTVLQLTAPVKPTVEEAPKTKPAEEKEVVKQDTKPATEEKPVVKTEPVKNEKDEAAKKQTQVEPDSKPATEVAKPATELAKKEVAPPPTVQRDTIATVVKPQDQPVATTPKTAEPGKPKTVEPEKKAETGSKLVMINSDCVKLATDNDVDKMRVKMMNESDLQKKLAIANKYFKTMCLYARQIKALSEMFPTDEARYKFLEMAYPFAADTANFKQLYELLTDEAYVTQFKKLVRLQ